MTGSSNIQNLIANSISSVKSKAGSQSNDTTTTTAATTATKTFSITLINGETHSLVIDEGGNTWDHNETDGTWMTREDDGSILDFAADLSTDEDTTSVDFASIKANSLSVRSGSTVSNYKIKSGSTISGIENDPVDNIQTDFTRDVDPSTDNVYVIDDFTHSLFDEGGSSSSEIDISHGELVEAIINSGNDDATSTTKTTTHEVSALDSTGAMTYSSIDNAIQSVIAKVNSGQDVDAVNMSLGAAVNLEDLGLGNISLNDLSNPATCSTVITALTNAATPQNDYANLVKVIQDINTLANKGVQVYISSGNDYDDDYYNYDDTSVYGIKNDNTVYGVKGDNTDIIANSSSTSTLYTSGTNAYNLFAAADGCIDGVADGVITQQEFYAYNEYYSSADTDGDNNITSNEMYNMLGGDAAASTSTTITQTTVPNVINIWDGFSITVGYTQTTVTTSQTMITGADLYSYYDGDKYLGTTATTGSTLTGSDFYDYYSSYDTNGDGEITGQELGVFNALTLASSSNVHVIGATSATGDNSVDGVNGIADYTDVNGTVDAYYNGDVDLAYLGENTSGQYMWDVDGDGKVDIYSTTNPDNLTTGYYYPEDGTSFASPLALKTKDQYLT